MNCGRKKPVIKPDKKQGRETFRRFSHTQNQNQACISCSITIYTVYCYCLNKKKLGAIFLFFFFYSTRIEILQCILFVLCFLRFDGDEIFSFCLKRKKKNIYLILKTKITSLVWFEVVGVCN